MNNLPEENSFGIVKRIRVVQEWIEAQRSGKAPLRILDFGCGTGELLTQQLGKNGDTICGIDFHEETIAYARKISTRPEVTYRKSSLEELLKETGRFDVVVCSEVLEHVHEPLDFLNKLRELLVPGGVLVVTTPNGYGPYEMLSRVQKVMHGIGLSKGKPPQPDAASGFLNLDSGHVQFFRVGDLMRLFKDSRFTVEKRRARSFLCGPYVDPLFGILPFRKTIFAINNCLADILPFSFAADWMFLLKRA